MTLILTSCSYILKVPFDKEDTRGIVYVWVGNDADAEEARITEEIARDMYDAVSGRFLFGVMSQLGNCLEAKKTSESSYQSEELRLTLKGCVGCGVGVPFSRRMPMTRSSSAAD